MLKKPDFVHRFVQAGLTYAQAYVAYQALIGLVEDGVAERSKIRFGHVGVLKPVKRRPRTVTMGFRRDATGVQKVKRTYVLGTRVSYAFRVYRAFGQQHDLMP